MSPNIIKYEPVKGGGMDLKFVIDWVIRLALGAGIVVIFLMNMKSDIKENKTTLTAMNKTLEKIDKQVGEVVVKLQVNTAVNSAEIKSVLKRVELLENRPAYSPPKRRRGRR